MRRTRGGVQLNFERVLHAHVEREAHGSALFARGADFLIKAKLDAAQGIEVNAGEANRVRRQRALRIRGARGVGGHGLAHALRGSARLRRGLVQALTQPPSQVAVRDRATGRRRRILDGKAADIRVGAAVPKREELGIEARELAHRPQPTLLTLLAGGYMDFPHVDVQFRRESRIIREPAV